MNDKPVILVRLVTHVCLTKSVTPLITIINKNLPPLIV